MEIKVLLYLAGIVIYFIYKQYQKLQKEAIERKAKLESDNTTTPQLIVVEQVKPVQRVKSERKQIEVESARLREQNKMRSVKTPKPFFEKPEHVTSVFDSRDLISQSSFDVPVLSESNGNNSIAEIDIRKMILYSELLKRPAW